MFKEYPPATTVCFHLACRNYQSKTFLRAFTLILVGYSRIIFIFYLPVSPWLDVILDFVLHRPGSFHLMLVVT